MTKVAAIHTVQSVYASFPETIRQAIPGIEVTNTLDEFLASDPQERGEFTKNNLNRMHAILRCAEMTGADAIVVSCSTLTPAVEALRPLIATPLVAVDGPMLKKAVGMGTKITILATARSTVEPCKQGLTREAKAIGKTIELEVVLSDEAFTALKKMDKATHDKEVLAKAAGIKDRDVVVLAQASTAHLEKQVGEICGIPTLSSPALCMEELKRVLGK